MYRCQECGHREARYKPMRQHVREHYGWGPLDLFGPLYGGPDRFDEDIEVLTVEVVGRRESLKGVGDSEVSE